VLSFRGFTNQFASTLSRPGIQNDSAGQRADKEPNPTIWEMEGRCNGGLRDANGLPALEDEL
jgi:hypothetical protein